MRHTHWRAAEENVQAKKWTILEWGSCVCASDVVPEGYGSSVVRTTVRAFMEEICWAPAVKQNLQLRAL